jgi:hypothetical protein
MLVSDYFFYSAYVLGVGVLLFRLYQTRQKLFLIVQNPGKFVVTSQAGFSRTDVVKGLFSNET